MPKATKAKHCVSKPKSPDGPNPTSNGLSSTSRLALLLLARYRYKGTKELSDSLKYSLTREGDKCILVINNVTPDDVDEYSIKARNKAGSRMTRCNVNVRCKSEY